MKVGTTEGKMYIPNIPRTIGNEQKFSGVTHNVTDEE
jgi:hypothetical protein